MCGYTKGSLDHNQNLGSEDAFLTRFDADGQKAWTRQWGSRMTEYGLSVATDDASNAFVTGYTYGSVEADASHGGQDAFLSGFSRDGTALFNRQWGSVFDDNARSLTVLGTVLLVVGDTQGALTGVLPSGGRDAFLSTYDTEGRSHWTEQWGQQGDDFALGVAAGSDGAVYVGGYRELPEESGAGRARDAILSKWLVE